MATFKAGRLHKAFVRADDQLWREFRAILVGRGVTVQDALGDMVRREVAKDKRDKKRREAARDKKARETKAAASKLGVKL